jgi:predicted CoA-binding protein
VPAGEPEKHVVLRQRIDAFLAAKRIGFVGVSRGRRDFSRTLFRAFQARGYDMIPVNPHAEEIEGARCYARVGDVAPKLDAALVMAPRTATTEILEDCSAAGVSLVWLYGLNGPSAATAEAAAFCEQRDMQLIPGYCPFMFLSGAGWMHRLHGWILKCVGRYPAQPTAGVG